MKNKIYLPVILALIIGLVIGYLLNGQLFNNSTSMMDHDEMNMEDSGSHDHKMMELSSHDDLPEVDLIVHKDLKSGWNAQIITKNFVFAPENVSTNHVTGQGHAHIYIDGVKINRVYSEWHHLGSLEPGIHKISVKLSTNDHRELSHDGELITDIESVVVQ